MVAVLSVFPQTAVMPLCVWPPVLRERLEAAIAPLPFRQAAFVSGILLGDKSLLLNEERNVLSQTGFTHVFAVAVYMWALWPYLQLYWPRLYILAGVGACF
jgi:hypothetical protein